MEKNASFTSGIYQNFFVIVCMRYSPHGLSRGFLRVLFINCVMQYLILIGTFIVVQARLKVSHSDESVSWMS